MVSKVFTGSVKLNKPGGRVSLLPEPPESINLGMMQKKDGIFFTIIRLSGWYNGEIRPIGALTIRRCESQKVSPDKLWNSIMRATFEHLKKRLIVRLFQGLLNVNWRYELMK